MILPLFQEVKMAGSLSAQGAKEPQALRTVRRIVPQLPYL